MSREGERFSELDFIDSKFNVRSKNHVYPMIYFLCLNQGYLITIRFLFFILWNIYCFFFGGGGVETQIFEGEIFHF